MELPQHVEIRPDVMMGKACLKGTRIPVYLVLEKLAAGETVEQILEAYPQLTRDHVNAALKYAARLASEETVLAS
jgi:uncharacterized protein (DUF433 family)